MKKFLVVFLFLFGCAHLGSKSSESRNSNWAMSQPYVIYISIDGYRYDYTDLFQPSTLSKIRDDGISSESLIPIYPSKTFASHYSMITGLTAEHSGVVANEFYDPKLHLSFSSGSKKDKAESRWYLGHTLWELTKAKNMLSASYYWVGSETLIHNVQPDYWFPYDESVPNMKRVAQVLDWLKLPEEKRPHLINLYFSNVDLAGHIFGATSDEVKKEVMEVDSALSELLKGVRQFRSHGLPVNIVIVSDHGMDDVNSAPEFVDDEADLSGFIISGHGPEMKLYLREAQSESLILKTQKALQAKAKHYKVYLRNEVPENLHYRASERIGDLVLVVDEPYLVETHALFRASKNRGNHGWDARKYEKMRGIFYAEGPAYKAGVRIPAFENFNVYSVITHLLSLEDLGLVDSRYLLSFGGTAY